MINQKENLDSFLFPPFLNIFPHLRKASIKFEEVYPFLFCTIIYEYVYFIIIVGLGLLSPLVGHSSGLSLCPFVGIQRQVVRAVTMRSKLVENERFLLSSFAMEGWLISQFTGVFSSAKSSYFSLVLVE